MIQSRKDSTCKFGLRQPAVHNSKLFNLPLWLVAPCQYYFNSRQLHRYILFTDEAQFNRDGVNNTHNSHVWADKNPHATVENNFRLLFVSMCGVQFWTISWLVLSSWKVVLQERRTSDFCRRNCPDFWGMCFWINEVVFISNMTELLLIFHAKLEISWTIVSLSDGSEMAVPTNGQPGLQTLAHWIIVYGDGWKKLFTVWRWEGELHCLVAFWMPQAASETINGRCNEQLAQFTTERQPVLRPAVAFSKTSFKHRSIQI